MFIKKVFFILICFIGLTFKVHGQTITKLDKNKLSFVSLDKKIQSLMKAANVQGLAISIFNNNEPVYKKTFVLETAIGDIFTPWYWENYIPYDQPKK